MIEYLLCAQVLIERQMEKMYGSLGHESVYAQEYRKALIAKKAQRVRYSERIGRLLIRVGERLLRSAGPHNMSKEAILS